MSYPTLPRSRLVDTLHGVPVADPFRRFESADDPDTVAWVAEQNALTRCLVDEQADLYAFLFHYLTRTSASEHTRR